MFDMIENLILKLSLDFELMLLLDMILYNWSIEEDDSVFAIDETFYDHWIWWDSSGMNFLFKMNKLMWIAELFIWISCEIEKENTCGNLFISHETCSHDQKTRVYMISRDLRRFEQSKWTIIGKSKDWLSWRIITYDFQWTSRWMINQKDVFRQLT